MTALPMTGFHRAQISLHGKQYFRNTATFGILPSPLHSMIHRLQTERRDSFRVRDSHPIPLFSEQECVSDCSGRAFATKAMLFSLLYARLILRTQKDLSCPAILQTKEVSCSLYIRFDCTQKLPFYLNRKGWLVARIVPIIYIFITIYHACVHFLSKIYILILPQSGVIVKRKIFRGFGRIFGCDYLLGSRLSNFVGIRRKFL